MKAAVPITVEGVELDLRMRGFEFFSLVSSYSFDSLRPMHLKATGRIKFQGKVIKPLDIPDVQVCYSEANIEDMQLKDDEDTHSLVGEVSISGLKLNQLILAPQLVGALSISRQCVKVCLIKPCVCKQMAFEKVLEISIFSFSYLTCVF